ncbi:phosphatidylinositol synthase [Plasmodium gaboni]|uniref:CDP-diacylglycerol--inositol 3-phosphatidyltransferase n=1 Tax=Plasmodium gaboni TaxID=647221 RepID=A0A151LDJ5_9APIC|nr:phosphatidylinositol synthase [Plasmodium gaboni]KYN96957.1 phosphatidylinositol synthase [Plasmodium gaboni]SOV17340.1 phosphatidylinositol synthase [Plasmodium gaboni]SOV24210.1 phosphatidylinositol synthase [Plasmodium sp. DRC-Itaito]
MKMKKKNVYLYIPNIIGYIRVILALLGFIISRKNILLFVCFYGASQVLDALDGWTARKFNQTSVFGQILDQITDRLSTSLLYLLNSSVYEEYITLIGLIMIADIAGHYFHSTSCAIAGNKTHKKIEKGNKLLKLYYEKPWVMVICIIAYESFLICAYLLRVTVKKSLIYKLSYYALICSFPLAAFKMFTNVSQGVYGVKCLVDMDCKKK